MRRTWRKEVLAAVLLVTAVTTTASSATRKLDSQRSSFVRINGSQREVPVAEVCSYPVVGRVDWLAQLGAAASAECVAASDFDAPTQPTFAFARTRDATSDVVLLNGDEASADFRLIESAAINIPTARAGSVFVLYRPESGALLPFANGTKIPKSVAAAVFEIRDEEPVAVYLTESSSAPQLRVLRLALPVLVVPVYFPPTAVAHAARLVVSAYVAPQTPLEAMLPDVAAIAGRAVVQLFRFSGSPQDTIVARAHGKDWVPAELRALRTSSPVQVTNALQAASLKPVRVSWNPPPAFVRGQRIRTSCETHNGDGANLGQQEVELAFWKCEALSVSTISAPVDESHCRRAAAIEGALAEKWSDHVQGLKPGVYLLTAEHAALPIHRRVVSVSGEGDDVDVSPDWFVVTGKVSRGSEPLHAQVTFATGDAFTDEAGEFVAVLREDPRSALVWVEGCSGGVAHVHKPDPASQPANGSRYDIEVPLTAVSIHVRDAETKAPVSGASVRLLVPNGADGYVYGRIPRQRTDDNGFVRIESLTPNQPIEFVAIKDGYKSQRSASIVVNDGEEKTLAISLLRVDAARGRLSGPRRGSLSGTLFWFSPAGEFIASATTDADGRFVYKHRASMDQLVFFSGAELPLSFVQYLGDADDELALAVPNDHSRDVSVTLPAEVLDRVFITFALDNVVVPLRVISEHLVRRNASADLAPGVTMTVRGLPRSRQLHVLALPFSVLVGQDGSRIDHFYAPYAAAARRYAVRPSNVVVLK